MAGRRDEVFAVLQGATEPLSITAIADALGIHPNTARFHLDVLAKTGQVERVETEPAKPGRPASMFRRRMSERPGSKNGTSPAWRRSILCASTSMPTTSCPSSAMQAACVAPR